MEHEDRSKKLLAGKEKLAAFQRKRARRKKKKETDDASSVYTWSETSSLADLSDVASTGDFSDTGSLVDENERTATFSEEESDGTRSNSGRRISRSVALVRAQNDVKRMTNRVTELEEILQGKQDAMCRLMEENKQLQSSLALKAHSDSTSDLTTSVTGSLDDQAGTPDDKDAEDQSVDETYQQKLDDFEKALKKRDEVIAQLTENLQATTVSRDNLQQEYTAQAAELARQVQTLQLQLKQAGDWLKNHMGEHGVSAQALLEAKNELLALQQVNSHREQELAAARTAILERDQALQKVIDQYKNAAEQANLIHKEYSKLQQQQVQYGMVIEQLTQAKEEVQSEKLAILQQLQEAKNSEVDNSKLTTLKEELKNNQQRIENLERTLSDRNRDISKLKETLVQKDQSLQQMVQSLSAFGSSSSDESSDALSKTIEKQQSEISNLQEILQNKDQKLHHLNEKFSRTSDELKTLFEEVTVLKEKEKEVLTLRQTIHEREENLLMLQNTIRDKEEKLLVLQQSFIEQQDRSTNESLQGEGDTNLNETLSRLQEELIQKDEALKQLSERFRTLSEKSTLPDLENKNKCLEDKLQKLAQDNAVVLEENKQLKEAGEEINEIAAKIPLLSQEIQRLGKENLDLKQKESQMYQLVEQMKEREKILSNLNNENQQLIDKEKLMQKEMAELQEKIQSVGDVSTELEQMKMKYLELQHKTEAAELENTQIKSNELSLQTEKQALQSETGSTRQRLEELSKLKAWNEELQNRAESAEAEKKQILNEVNSYNEEKNILTNQVKELEKQIKDMDKHDQQRNKDEKEKAGEVPVLKEEIETLKQVVKEKDESLIQFSETVSRLNCQLDSLAEENQRLTEEANNILILKAELESAQGDMMNIKSTLEQKEADLESTRNLVNSLEKQVSTLKDENKVLKDLQNEVQCLKDDVVSRENEIVELNKEASRKDEEIQQMSGSIACLQDNTSSVNAKIVQKEKEIEQLQLALNESKKNITEITDKVTNLTEKIHTLELENRGLKEQAVDFEKLQTTAASEKDSLISELQDLVRSKHLEIEGLQARVAHSQQDKFEMDETTKLLTEQLNQSTAKSTETENEMQDIKAQLTATQSANDSLENSIKEKDDKLIELTDRVGDLTLNISRISTELESKQNGIEEMSGTITCLQEKVSSINVQNVQKEKEVEQLQLSLNESKNNISEITDRVADFTEKIHSLELENRGLKEQAVDFRNLQTTAASEKDSLISELQDVVRSKQLQTEELQAKVNLGLQDKTHMEETTKVLTEQLNQSTAKFCETESEMQDLKSQLTAKESANDSLEKAIKEKDAQLTELTDKIGDFTANISKISSELESKQNEISQKNSTIDSLHKDIDRYDTKIHTYETDILCLEKELERYKAENENLHESEDGLFKTQGEVTVLKEALKERNEKLTELTANMSNIREEMSQLSKVNELLRIREDELTQAQASVQEHLDIVNKQVTTLKEENSLLAQKEKNLLEKQEEIDKSASLLEEANASLQSLQEEYDNMKCMYEAELRKVEELNVMKGNLDQMTVHLTKMQEENTEMKNKIADGNYLKDQLETERGSKNTLIEEVQNLKEQLEQASYSKSENVSASEAALGQLRSDPEELQEENTALTDQLTDNAEQQAELQEVQKLLDKAYAENAELKVTLNELLSQQQKDHLSSLSPDDLKVVNTSSEEQPVNEQTVPSGNSILETSDIVNRSLQLDQAHDHAVEGTPMQAVPGSKSAPEETAGLKEMLAQRESDLVVLHNTVQTQQVALQQMHQQLTEVTQYATHLSHENEKLKAESAVPQEKTSSAPVSGSESSTYQDNSKGGVTEESIKDLQMHIKKQKDALDDMTNRYTKLSEENHTLKQQLSQKVEAAPRESSAPECLQEELSSTNSNISTETTALHTYIQQQRSHMEQMSQRMTEMAQYIAQVQQQNAQLAEKDKANEKALQDAAQISEETMKQKKILEEELSKEKEVNTALVESSDSWITIEAENKILKRKEKESTEVVQQLMKDIENIRRSRSQSPNSSDIASLGGSLSADEHERRLSALRAELEEQHGEQIVEMKQQVQQQMRGIMNDQIKELATQRDEALEKLQIQPNPSHDYSPEIVQTLRSKVEELQEKIKSVEGETEEYVFKLKEQQNQYEEELAKVYNERDSFKALLNDSEAEKATALALSEGVFSQMENEKQIKESQAKEVDVLNQRVIEIMSERDQALDKVSEMVRLQTDKTSVSPNSDIPEGQISNVQGQVQEMAQQIQELARERDEALARIQAQEQSLNHPDQGEHLQQSQLLDAHEYSPEIVRSLRSEVEELQGKLKNIEGKTDDYMSKLKEQQNHYEEELAKVYSERDSFKAILNDSEAEKAKALAHSEDLFSLLENEKHIKESQAKEVDILNQRVIDIMSERDQALDKVSEIVRLQSEETHGSPSSEVPKDQSSNVQGQVQEMAQQLQELARERDDALARIQAQEQSLNEPYQEEHPQQSQLVDALKREIDALSAQLNDVNAAKEEALTHVQKLQKEMCDQKEPDAKYSPAANREPRAERTPVKRKLSPKQKPLSPMQQHLLHLQQQLLQESPSKAASVESEVVKEEAQVVAAAASNATEKYSIEQNPEKGDVRLKQMQEIYDQHCKHQAHQIEQLNAELARLGREREEAMSQLEQYQKHYESHVQKLVEQEKREGAQRVKAIHEELNVMKKERDEVTDKLESIQAVTRTQIRELTEQVNGWKTKYNEISQNFSGDSTAALARIQAELEGQIEELKAKLEASEKEKEDANAQVKEIKMAYYDLEGKNPDIAGYRQRLEDIESTLKVTWIENEELKGEVASLKSKIKAHETPDSPHPAANGEVEDLDIVKAKLVAAEAELERLNPLVSVEVLVLTRQMEELRQTYAHQLRVHAQELTAVKCELARYQNLDSDSSESPVRAIIKPAMAIKSHLERSQSVDSLSIELGRAQAEHQLEVESLKKSKGEFAEELHAEKERHRDAMARIEQLLKKMVVMQQKHKEETESMKKNHDGIIHEMSIQIEELKMQHLVDSGNETANITEMKVHFDQIISEKHRLLTERDQLIQEKHDWDAERERLKGRIAQVVGEKDLIAKQRDSMRKAIEKVELDQKELDTQQRLIAAEKQQLLFERDQLNYLKEQTENGSSQTANNVSSSEPNSASTSSMLQQYKDQVTLLQQERSLLLQDHKVELASLSAENDELKQRLDQLDCDRKQELEELQEKLNFEINELELKVESMQQEETAQSDQPQQYVPLEEELRRARAEQEELIKEFSSRSVTHLAEWKLEREEMEKEFEAKLRAEIEEQGEVSTTRITELEAKLKETTEEADAVAKDRDRITEEHAQLLDALRSQEAELVKLQTACSRVKEERDTLQGEHMRMLDSLQQDGADTVRQLTQQIHQLHQHRQKMQEEQSQMVKEIQDEYNADRSELQRNLDELRARHTQEMQELNARYEAEVTTYKQKHAEVLDEVHTLRRENYEMRTVISDPHTKQHIETTQSSDVLSKSPAVTQSDSLSPNRTTASQEEKDFQNLKEEYEFKLKDLEEKHEKELKNKEMSLSEKYELSQRRLQVEYQWDLQQQVKQLKDEGARETERQLKVARIENERKFVTELQNARREMSTKYESQIETLRNQYEQQDLPQVTGQSVQQLQDVITRLQIENRDLCEVREALLQQVNTSHGHQEELQEELTTVSAEKDKLVTDNLHLQNQIAQLNSSTPVVHAEPNWQPLSESSINFSKPPTESDMTENQQLLEKYALVLNENQRLQETLAARSDRTKTPSIPDSLDGSLEPPDLMMRLQDQVRSLETENEGLRTHMEDQNLAAHEELGELQGKYIQLVAENESLRAKLQKYNDDDSLDEDITVRDSDRRDTERLQSCYATLAEENEILRAKLGSYGLPTESVAEEESLALPSRDHQPRYELIRKENETLRAKLQAYTYQGSQERDGHWKEKYDAILREYAILRSQLEELGLPIDDSIQKGLEELQVKFDQVVKEKETLQVKLTTVRENAEKDFRELQARHSDLHSDHTSLSKEHAEYKAMLEKDKDKSKREFLKTKSKLANVSKELEALKSKLEKATKETQTLKSKLDQAEARHKQETSASQTLTGKGKKRKQERGNHSKGRKQRREAEALDDSVEMADESMQEELDNLKLQYTSVVRENDSLRSEVGGLKCELGSLKSRLMDSLRHRLRDPPVAHSTPLDSDLTHSHGKGEDFHSTPTGIPHAAVRGRPQSNDPLSNRSVMDLDLSSPEDVEALRDRYQAALEELRELRNELDRMNSKALDELMGLQSEADALEEENASIKQALMTDENVTSRSPDEMNQPQDEQQQLTTLKKQLDDLKAENEQLRQVIGKASGPTDEIIVPKEHHPVFKKKINPLQLTHRTVHSEGELRPVKENTQMAAASAELLQKDKAKRTIWKYARLCMHVLVILGPALYAYSVSNS